MFEINWPLVATGIGFVVLIGFALLAVVIAVLAGVAMLKRKTGIDVSDGIDATEWDQIRNIVRKRKAAELETATRQRMVAAANDGLIDLETARKK